MLPEHDPAGNESFRLECDLEAIARCGDRVVGNIFSHVCEGQTETCLSQEFGDKFNKTLLLEWIRASALAQLNDAFRNERGDHQYDQDAPSTLTCWAAGTICNSGCPLVPKGHEVSVLHSNKEESHDIGQGLN